MQTETPGQLDPIAVLDEAPDDAFALLELRLDWPPELDVTPQKYRLWLRFFVMTGDPLAWIADRGEAWAATTLTEDVLELDVYVLLPALRRELQAHDGDLAAAVAHWAAPAMHAALKYELVIAADDYHDRLAAGKLPRLLSDLDVDHGVFARPSIQVGQSWGSVGLGALQDLVGEAFGRVDLDRSPVTLDPVTPGFPHECAACDGKSFAFPSGLEDARDGFCAQHRAAAKRINIERLRRAHESNPAGWRAIDKAAMRVNKLPEPTFAPQPPRIVGDATNRNDPCPCGSGRKYKRCHGA